MNTTISKRLLCLLLALAASLSLCVPAFADKETGGTTAVTTVVDTVLKNTMAQEKTTLTSPTFGNEWVILGFARSGYLEKGSKYFNDYYANAAAAADTMAKNVQEMGGAPEGALHLVKCTENSRLIIALSAMGRDARSVGDWDIVAPYESFSWIEGQGLNSVIFALIALDSGSYETKDSTIRQKCIDYILGRQLSDGGWDVRTDSTSADPDMTAMAVQALVPYYEKSDTVKAAVGNAITKLSDMQNSDGSYSSYGAVNSESTAQVIVACAAMGIDPHTDRHFIKNGKSAVDALLTFYNAGEQAFHHVMKDSEGRTTTVDGMATEQAVYAMAAYQRLANGKTSLYDMSDVKANCTDGKHTFGEWKEAAATCTEKGYKSRTCATCGYSEFVDTAAAPGHRRSSGYEMSDTKHWIPCAVCGTHLKEAAHSYTGDQCIVCSYHKLGGRIEVTELTEIPSALQSISTLNSVTKLKAQMLAAAQKVDKSIAASNTKLLDVSLLVPDTAGGWSDGAGKLPANGRITVLLPYPDGTGKLGYEFVVVHTFTTSDFGKTVGAMESPSVTKTANGLQVTTTGLSPIMIGWKAGTDSLADKITKAANTGDSSQMGLWVCGVLLPAAAVTVMVRNKKRSAR